MQIPLGSKQPRFQVNSSEPLNLEAGNTGFAVRVGDRLVGFAGENVSSVAMTVQAGELHITLQAQDGKPLGEYQIPSTDLLRGRLDDLMRSGIFFSAGEREQLADLVKLSMTGGVAKSEMLLMLDEISHIAPSLGQTQSIDTGDLYPDLAKQVKQILKAMPDEIQRFVLLNNFERFSEEEWKAFQLIGKIDPGRDKALSRFLAGVGVADFKVGAELSQVAARPPLPAPMDLKGIDGKALAQLTTMTKDLSVAGNPRLIDFPTSLAKHIFDKVPLDIPDFTAADSFEELQARFMLEHTGEKSAPSLSSRLARFLDTGRYRELADFLVGKPGAGFNTMVKESFLHFLKNPPKEPAFRQLSSVDHSAMNRLVKYVETTGKADLLQNLKALPDETEGLAARRLGKALQSMNRLSAPQREAMFVMDHLDPTRDKSLFDYVQGDHKLSKMTDSLKRDLAAFLSRSDFPPVRGGVSQFRPEIFTQLSQELGRGEGKRIGDFFPQNPTLREALAGMESAQEVGSARSLDKQARALERDLKKEPSGEVRNQKVTDFLQKSLQHFKRVAVLDQMWKAESLAESIVNDRQGKVDAKVSSLTSTLKTVKALLEGRPTGMIQWHLHRDGDTVWTDVSARQAAPSQKGERHSGAGLAPALRENLAVPENQPQEPVAFKPKPKVQRLSEDADELIQDPVTKPEKQLPRSRPDVAQEVETRPEKMVDRIRSSVSGPARFLELDRWLEINGDLSKEKLETSAYLKANRLLMRLERRLGTDMVAPLLEKFLPLLPEMEALPPGAMAEMLNDRVADLKGPQRNEALSELLKGRLRNYFRIAVLDQVWRADRLTGKMLDHSVNDIHRGSVEISRALRSVRDLLARKPDSAPDWDLWTRQPEPEPESGRLGRTKDPHPPFDRKLVAEKKGLERYFHMDKVLPERQPGLVRQLEELGWSRRLESLIDRVDQYRETDHPKLLKTLERGRPILRELAQLLTEGEQFDWAHHAKSPLNNRKQRQFQALRDVLLKGGDLDVESLFDGPFLKSEFGDKAEALQAREMKRFEPMFKEALSRFAAEPKEVIEQMLTRMFQAPEMAQGDVRDKLGQFLENMRDFNQHQNLNNAPLYMSIPLNMGNQSGEFELAYFKMPNKEKDRKRFLVVIHLDFETWGHLRVDALKDHETVSATFWVETRKMHHHLLGELHQLEDRLEELGLGEAMLNIKIEPSRAAKPLLDLCAPGDDNELDLQI